MIIAYFLFITLVVMYVYGRDRPELKVSGWGWLDLKRVPGRVWNGVGTSFLGIVWGTTYAVNDPPNRESIVLALVVFIGIGLVVIERLRTARPRSPGKRLVPWPTWLALGIVPGAFLSRPTAEVPFLIEHMIGYVIALWLMASGWRRARKGDPEDENPASARPEARKGFGPEPTGVRES